MWLSLLGERAGRDHPSMSDLGCETDAFEVADVAFYNRIEIGIDHEILRAGEQHPTR
jgi:hypothetical protein